MTYYTFVWNEGRGDAFDQWGASTWYVEVDANQNVVKQIEHYATGIMLTYDLTHMADRYGMVSDTAFDAGGTTAMTGEEFYRLWNTTHAYNRA